MYDGAKEGAALDSDMILRKARKREEMARGIEIGELLAGMLIMSSSEFGMNNFRILVPIINRYPHL